MLYPDFYELIEFKGRKSKLKVASRPVKSTLPGNHHSPFRGQGLEFDSVREYVPGDDIRSIDWRVTARTGAPHVKIFREDRERQICLCVDMNAAMRFGTKCTFKSVQAARAAAILGWQSIARQDRVSACLFGDVKNGMQYFAPQRTRKSFCAMLKMLSDPPVKGGKTTLNEALLHISQSVHTGAIVYLISDFMSLDSQALHEATLSRLAKQCDVIFITINDQADKSIFPIGGLGFSWQGEEKMIIDTKDAVGRNAFESQWKKNRLYLKELTSRLKISTIELSTESDISRDLIAGLKMIGRRKKR